MTFAAPGGEVPGFRSIRARSRAQMVSVFSEVERKRIGERTKEALAVTKAQGVRLGRPASIPAPLAKRIVRMRERGMTLQAICDQLNAEGVCHRSGRPVLATDIAAGCPRTTSRRVTRRLPTAYLTALPARLLRPNGAPIRERDPP